MIFSPRIWVLRHNESPNKPNNITAKTFLQGVKYDIISIFVPFHEKKGPYDILMAHAYNEGPDQHGHPCSLFRAFGACLPNLWTEKAHHTAWMHSLIWTFSVRIMTWWPFSYVLTHFFHLTNDVLAFYFTTLRANLAADKLIISFS